MRLRTSALHFVYTRAPVQTHRALSQKKIHTGDSCFLPSSGVLWALKRSDCLVNRRSNDRVIHGQFRRYLFSTKNVIDSPVENEYTMDYLPGESASILAIVYSCSYPTPFVVHYPTMVSFLIVQLSLISYRVSNILRPTFSRPFHRRCHSSLLSRSRHHLSLCHQLLAPEHHSFDHSDHTFLVPHSHISVPLLPRTLSQHSAHSLQRSPRTSLPRSFCTSLLLRQRSRPCYLRLLIPAPRHSLLVK